MDWLWGGMLGWGLSITSMGIPKLIRLCNRRTLANQLANVMRDNYGGGENFKWATPSALAAILQESQSNVLSALNSDKRFRMDMRNGEKKWGLLEVVGPAKVGKPLKPGIR